MCLVSGQPGPYIAVIQLQDAYRSIPYFTLATDVLTMPRIQEGRSDRGWSSGVGSRSGWKHKVVGAVIVQTHHVKNRNASLDVLQ